MDPSIKSGHPYFFSIKAEIIGWALSEIYWRSQPKFQWMDSIEKILGETGN